MGRQHKGMDRPRVRQVPEGSGERVKMEKTGCKIIRGAPTTLAVEGLMTTMMMIKRRHIPEERSEIRYSGARLSLGTL